MKISGQLSAAFLLLSFGMLSGCGSNSATTRPLSASQQQEEVLRDPMAYKPSVGHDITSGDITTLDQKGLNRDLDDVLNP